MIALKNVLWWICSLMHGKLLLALMEAVCAGEGERHLPPAFKSRLIMFCLCLSLCGMPKAMYSWKICGFLKFLLPFFVTFLTIFDSLVLENCRMGLLFQRLCVQCLAMLSNPCLFPALERGSRHKAKGSMWRVCSKDVGMNHFTQLTFQPGNQACFQLWVPCGTHFSPQESSLSPFLCSLAWLVPRSR